MIGTPTTFVVGAGASAPYGLPTGPDVCQRARGLFDSLRHQDFGSLNAPALTTLRLVAGVCGPDELQEFKEALRTSDPRTIDQFLEAREGRESLVAAGSALVATIVGEAEVRRIDSEHSPEANADWLAYLAEQLGEGVTAQNLAARNKVRFVTFNFDSVIEDRLKAELTAFYGPERVSEVSRAVAAFDVVHVHGALPPLRGNVTEKWLRAAVNTIRLTTHTIEPDVLEKAHTYIREAKVVCFLGFAYWWSNLERLGIPLCLAPEAALFGTAWELESGEKRRVMDRIGGGAHTVELGEKRENCRELLRKRPILRD